MMNRSSFPDRARRAALAAGMLALGACDLGVTNPAVLTDEQLNDPRLVESLVNGVRRDVSASATGTVLLVGGSFEGAALLSDELVASTQRDAFRALSDGLSLDNLADNRVRWALSSSARWTAEDALRRVPALVPDSTKSEPLAVLSVWAGYINRMMGDNFCGAVIDGGPLQPSSEYHRRAVAHFTRGIERAQAAGIDSLVLGAYAGRAQSYMMLGEWDKAVADAGRVPTNYVLPLYHEFTGGFENARNRLFQFTANEFEMTLWGTPYEQWGFNSTTPNGGDRRVLYTTPRNTATGQFITGTDARRPQFVQQKYTNAAVDGAIAKGTEMRLIEAEAALLKGDYPTALTKINEVRTFAGQRIANNVLPPAVANSVDATWPLLVRERGVEFYLEGRRLADFRRWETTPGKARVDVLRVRQAAIGQPATADPRVSVYQSNMMCLQISDTEKQSNPNFSRQ